MTTYFSEDFESCNLAGWTTGTAGSGSITCSSARAHGGSYSCRMYSPTASDKAFAYKDMTEITGDYHLRFYIWVDTSVTPDECHAIGLYDVSLGKYGVRCYIDYHDGDYYLRNETSTGVVDVCVIQTEQWVKVDAYFDDASGKVKYYVDDTYKGEFDAASATADPDRVYIGDVSDKVMAAYYYLDDILVDDQSPPAAYTKELTETLSLSDVTVKAPSIMRAETLGLIDSLAKGVFKSFIESLSLSDAVTALRVKIKELVETIGLSDVVVKFASIVRSETIAVADVLEKVKTMYREFVETIGLSDRINKLISIVRSETLSLTDILEKRFVILKILTETLGLSDTLARIRIKKTLARIKGVTRILSAIREKPAERELGR